MSSEALNIHPIEAQQIVDFRINPLKPEQWCKRDERVDAALSHVRNLYAI